MTDESTSEVLQQIKNEAVGKRMTKEERLKVFGSNLKKFREQAGMTKKAVAAAVGIIPQQYYRYEDGVSEPGVIMAIKLASLYSVDVQDLFLGMDDNRERLLAAVRQLNELGVKAEVTITGEVNAQILGTLPSFLSIDIIESLIEETMDDIRPSIKNDFANALAKNYLRHMSGL